MALQIDDLIPQRATFNLSSRPEPITLQAWTLKVRFWALKKYGAERLGEILKTQSLLEICEIVYFMMEENSKKLFPTFDEFVDSVVTTKDILALMTALLQSIGLSEPAVEELRKELHGRESPKPEAPTEEKKS